MSTSGSATPPTAVATPLVVGITGHRNLCFGELAPLRAAVGDLFAQLRREFPRLPLCVLSPLAAGADQLVAEVALAAGAELIAPLPVTRARYAADFQRAAREAFDALCDRAQVIELPPLPGCTPADAAADAASRNRHYAQAGVFVASHCHILVALWDGRPSKLLGGTAQVVRYHLEAIPPGRADARQARRAILESGDESLLYHIACSRVDAGGTPRAPAPPLHVLDRRWLSQDRVHPADGGIPTEFRRMFDRMQQYNDDADRHARTADLGAAAEMALAPDGGRNETVELLFATADTLAMHFQRRVLYAMRGLYALAALMGIAFVIYSDLPEVVPGQGNSIDAFVVLFAAGVLLAWLARRREWHRKYIDYRALAEGLRVQAYWRRAGIGAADPGAFAYDNFMQKQDIELGWIRNVMRAAGIRGMDDPILPGALDAVISEWIGDAGAEGQLAYYGRKAEQRSRARHRTHRLSLALLLIVAALGVVLAIFHDGLGEHPAGYLMSAMGVLAIVAATRESYAFRRADRELIRQYRYMHGIFATARRKIDADDDPGARRAVLHALGDAALAEHAEWALLHRERPPEAGKL